MDEDSASIQLGDRRLCNAVDHDLPPGPPGVDEKSGNENCEPRSSGSGKRGKSNSRRRSTSRGRSDSRNTSPSNTRRRHSVSRSLTPPRRRYDSPDYGRYSRRRFDRDRRRSPRTPALSATSGTPVRTIPGLAACRPDGEVAGRQKKNRRRRQCPLRM
ncbi:GM10709 [Drosophila sechellia]|uniref:GM10709 n=1 Tax=Drosophila sechellia TaxID=7238 RepID=B4I3M3_DROSE|nr:GM10709 [Drosophila sechellia]